MILGLASGLREDLKLAFWDFMTGLDLRVDDAGWVGEVICAGLGGLEIVHADCRGVGLMSLDFGLGIWTLEIGRFAGACVWW